MNYKHLTINERSKIEGYRQIGYSVRYIARLIGRSHSTVSRELSKYKTYDATKSQIDYQMNKKNCGSKHKLSECMKETIEHHLKYSWSPEQIVGRLYHGILSFKSIYRWIYEGLLNVTKTVLRQKGKRQKPFETRGRFNIGTSISKRPKEVRGRETFGHWELDTVVSGRGVAKGCVATFVERKSRWYQAILMPNRSADSMNKAFKNLYQRLTHKAFKTATTDRGKEFSCYKDLEKETSTKFYFADAYAAWQRGSNENSNGLFREFFPKGTNFDLVTQEEIDKVLTLINHRPRKCLGYKTASEIFEQEMVHLI